MWLHHRRGFVGDFIADEDRCGILSQKRIVAVFRRRRSPWDFAVEGDYCGTWLQKRIIKRLRYFRIIAILNLRRESL